ncbi:Hypothetical predicted protein [Xyrichtys novacula]|uniref:Uncharacterized protein n=1 Tax=Xyrichtys novacula TaxID=13765 RepID=A0AAV1FZZ8_XYRNO|nr:Hypothetical predicted protein [Xyrichtys novacula]
MNHGLHQEERVDVRPEQGVNAEPEQNSENNMEEEPEVYREAEQDMDQPQLNDDHQKVIGMHYYVFVMGTGTFGERPVSLLHDRVRGWFTVKIR